MTNLNGGTVMKKVLVMNTHREGYGVDQIDETMTVGDLVAYLQELDEDMPVYTGHDNRYTYGGISIRDFAEYDVDDDGEIVEDEDYY